jgi:hypothetical protein
MPRCAASADKVEGIGDFEAASGMLAVDVAHLIADIGDDGVALGFHLGPLSCLELLHGRQVVPVGARSELGPAFKARMIEGSEWSGPFACAGER